MTSVPSHHHVPPPLETAFDLRSMSSQPAWKTLLLETIASSFRTQGPSANYYTLSTCDLGPPVTPKARIVVHRGFLNEARAGEGVTTVQEGFDSNSVLLTTTDGRSPKALALTEQVRKLGKAHAEVCWWFNDANLQFRLACEVQLLPHKSKAAWNDGSLDPPQTRSANEFDWYFERTRLFEKMPPPLLASFANPTGGAPHPHEQELFEMHEPGPGKDAPAGLKSLVNPFRSINVKAEEAVTSEQKELVRQADLKCVSPMRMMRLAY